MIRQVAETKFGSGVDGGVNRLHRLLRGRQISSDEDVEVMLGGLRVRHLFSPVCQNGSKSTVRGIYATSVPNVNPKW